MAKNVIRLKSFGTRLNFAYVDHKNLLADQVFADAGISVKFCHHMKKKDCDYVIVHCLVKRKDEATFLDAMNKLNKKVAAFDHRGYEETCSRINELFT